MPITDERRQQLLSAYDASQSRRERLLAAYDASQQAEPTASPSGSAEPSAILGGLGPSLGAQSTLGDLGGAPGALRGGPVRFPGAEAPEVVRARQILESPEELARAREFVKGLGGDPTLPDEQIARAIAEQEVFGQQGAFGEPEPVTGAEAFRRQAVSGLAQVLPPIGAVGEFRQSRSELQPGEGTGGFLGDVVGGSLPFTAALLFPPAATPILAAYASDAASEKLDETGSVQAAVGAGVITALTEQLGLRGVGKVGVKTAQRLGLAFGSGDTKAAAKILVDVGAAGSIEAGEELAQLSLIAMSDVAAGAKDAPEAWAEVKANAGRSALGGFLGGSALELPGAAVRGAVEMRPGSISDQAMAQRRMREQGVGTGVIPPLDQPGSAPTQEGPIDVATETPVEPVPEPGSPAPGSEQVPAQRPETGQPSARNPDVSRPESGRTEASQTSPPPTDAERAQQVARSAARERGTVERSLGRQRVRRTLEERMPGVLQGSTRASIGLDPTLSERLQAEMLSENVDDHTALLIQTELMSAGGQIDQQRHGRIVGLDASLLEPGDSFSLGTHQGSVVDADADSVTIALRSPDSEVFVDVNEFMSFEGSTNTFTVPRDEVIPASQGTFAQAVEPEATPDATEQEASVFARNADRLRQLREQAQERIRTSSIPRGRDVGAASLPGDLLDAAIIGASYLAEGTLRFADYSTRMVQQFGEEIRPTLPRLFGFSKRMAANPDAIEEVRQEIDQLAAQFRTETPSETTAETPGGAEAPSLVAEAGQPDRGIEKREAGYQLAEETRRDLLRRKAQDRFLPVRRLQEAAGRAGRAVDPEQDVYRAEELFHGRLAERIEQADRDFAEPIAKIMADAKLSREQVDDFLYARHAKERNALIAARRPDMKDGGSGMTDAEADAVMARLRDESSMPALREIGRLIDRLNEQRIDVMLESGLISRSQARQWRRKFEHYVPLRTSEVDLGGTSESRTGIGRSGRSGEGFTVPGKETKAATGRASRADSPLVFSLQQLTETIMRAEKNKVSQRFLEFARRHPNDDLFEIDPVVVKRTVVDGPARDESTGDLFAESGQSLQLMDAGQIKEMVGPAGQFDRDIVIVKEEGRIIPVRVKHEALLAAMKNLEGDTLGPVLRALNKLTRGLAALNTSLNPSFVLVNLVRDAAAAKLNMSIEGKSRVANRALRNAPAAMKAVFAVQRDPDAKGEWADVYRQYRADGGQVGFFGLTPIEVRADRLAAQVARAGPGGLNQSRRAMRGLWELIRDLNTAAENAIRLGIYEASLRDGVTREDAASAAKNVTVNFNRKGELGAAVNSLYMFANANVQGSARIAQAAYRNPRGFAKWASAMTATSMAISMLNRLVADEDENGENAYDAIPEWVKSTNLVLMIPGTRRYLKIPLPYGYNVFHVVGTNLEAMVNGDRGAAHGAANVVDAALDAFNPVGGTGGLAEAPGAAFMQTISPTLLDPFVQSSMNRNFAGLPIKPERLPFGASGPESERAFRSVSPTSQAIARGINRITGGDDVTPGVVSISPETIDHFAGYFTGSAGAELLRTVNLVPSIATGDVQTQEVPIVRRFIGEPTESRTSQLFYGYLEKADQARFRMKGYAEAGDDRRLRRLIENHGRLIDMAPELRKIARAVGEIREAEETTTDPKVRRELEDKRLRIMQEANRKAREATK